MPITHASAASESAQLLRAVVVPHLLGCLLWQLSRMPDRNDPDDLTFPSVEEAVRRHEHLAKRYIWKLRNQTTRLGEFLEPTQCLLSTLTELPCCPWIVLPYVFESRQKLGTCGWRETYSQSWFPLSRASAWERTLSRSNPLPAAISCSPRARSKRIWRSYSARS